MEGVARITFILVLLLVGIIVCEERKVHVVVRSAGDHGAMYLRNEFAGVETHIINRVDDGRKATDFFPDPFSKLPVKDSHHQRKPWVNFSIPKEFLSNMEFISEAGGNGRECAGYLSFIIKNYHDLPDWMLFTHGTMQRIPKLTRQYLDDPESHYQSFSRTLVHRCFNDTQKGACSFRSDAKQVLQSIGVNPSQCVTTWCCNYFLVHKSRVLTHPIEDYHTLLEFSLTDRPGEAQWKHGCFYLEHFWHLIFREPADMYILKDGDVMNGDCMVNGDSYIDNVERPNPFNKKPYFWHKPYNTW